VPRARVEDEAGKVTEGRSKAQPRYRRLTKKAVALIAAVCLAGTNTRRVKRALFARFSWKPRWWRAGAVTWPSSATVHKSGSRSFASTRSALNGEFRRRIKTRTVLPCAESVPMPLRALLASGKLQMRKVDGWVGNAPSAPRTHAPRPRAWPERSGIHMPGARRQGISAEFATRPGARAHPRLAGTMPSPVKGLGKIHCQRRGLCHHRPAIESAAALQAADEEGRGADRRGLSRRHHAVVQEIGRRDRRLAVVELGEGHLRVGVHESLTDRVFDASTFSQNRRRRFDGTEVAQQIFDRIVEEALAAGLVGGEVL